MKFRIKTEEFKKGLNIANHATSSVTTTPILESILLKANFNNLVITANNLEMAIEYVISENIEIIQEGAACISGKIFINHISLIDDNEIDIELLKGNTIKITTLNSNLVIKGIELSEFPLIPKINEERSLKLKGKIIKRSIEKTLFSSAEGSIRASLAGIYVKIAKDEITFASTDTFRLSEFKNKISSNIESEILFIIPSKNSFQIKNIFNDNDDIKIIPGNNQIVFLTGNTKIYSRLLNGALPDYSSFFPKSYSTKSEINRVDLILALKKINLISRENNYSIKMSFSAENGILLETSQTQIGESKANLVGTIEGEDNIIGINSIFFLEVLSVIESSHISISFETPLSPILIRPIKDSKDGIDETEFKHIIMPLKV